jgi:Fe2+ or Zn2+ uptake regulation protein
MVLKIENIEKHLRDAGIKPSIQRLKIFDFIIKSMDHPTVDNIFNALSPEIPTLSKTTVYNTLKLFQTHGIVMVINIEDNETRYDADLSFHGHFKCKSCGKVYDFPISPNDLQFEALIDYSISESHYYLKGICKNCKN